MEFSPWLAGAAVFVVLLEGLASWSEKTFWPRQRGGPPIKLPFVWHGGVVVGDLILLPYLFGLWAPRFQIPMWLWIIFFPVALVITWYCHRAWWFLCEKQPGFMYPNRQKSEGDPRIWFHDLPRSALIHFGYMTATLMLIGGYLCSPMTAEVMWQTFWVLVIFVPVAIIEPGIVQGWPLTKKDVTINVGIAVALWTIIGLVTWAKLGSIT